MIHVQQIAGFIHNIIKVTFGHPFTYLKIRSLDLDTGLLIENFMINGTV